MTHPLHYVMGLAVFCLCLLGCSEADDPVWEAPLLVTHTKSTSPPTDTVNPHVWYYRTEVKNVSQRPMKIVWFEAYEFFEGIWFPGNVNNATLRGSDFSRWYTEGEQVTNGIIPPGGVAVCDSNWYGSNANELAASKWAYIAVDQHGNDYYVEGLVEPDVLTYVHDPDAPVEDAEAEVPIPAE